MKEIKAYKCDFCGKVYQRRIYCEKHEYTCGKNPDNKPVCWDCKYLQKGKFEFDPCADDSGSYITYFCDKRDEELMPITSAKKGYYENGISGNAIAMPKVCRGFIRRTIVVLTMKEKGLPWESGELFLDRWGAPIYNNNFRYIPYEGNEHIKEGTTSKDVKYIFDLTGDVKEADDRDLYFLFLN